MSGLLRYSGPVPLLAGMMLMLSLVGCGQADEGNAADGGGATSAVPGSTEPTGSANEATEAATSAATQTPGSSANGEQAPASVTFAKLGDSPELWPVYIAVGEGCFDDSNLDVSFVSAQSPSAVTQSVIAGSADLGSTGIPDIIRPIDAGGPVRIVASGAEKSPYSILAQPEIDGWEDLAGGQVIVGAQQDISRYTFDIAAAANGVDPAQLTYAFAGATANRYAALESGSVDAAILLPPFVAAAEAAGFTNLGKAAEYVPDSPFTGIVANMEWAEANSDALERFLACYVEATEWLYNPSNKDTATAILAEETNTEQAAAEAAYEYYIEDLHAFSETGTMDVQNLDALLQGLVEAGILTGDTRPAAEYIEDRYIEAATE